MLLLFVFLLQDAPRGYLKLLLLTAASGDNGHGEAIQRSTSLIFLHMFFFFLTFKCPFFAIIPLLGLTLFCALDFLQ